MTAVWKSSRTTKGGSKNAISHLHRSLMLVWQVPIPLLSVDDRPTYKMLEFSLQQDAGLVIDTQNLHL